MRRNLQSGCPGPAPSSDTASLQHPGETRHTPDLHLSLHKAKVTSNASKQTSEELSLALSFVFPSGHGDKLMLQETLSMEKIQKPLPQKIQKPELCPLPKAHGLSLLLGRAQPSASQTLIYSDEIPETGKPHPIPREQVMEVRRNNLPKVT